jgi:hypothetical protein
MVAVQLGPGGQSLRGGPGLGDRAQLQSGREDQADDGRETPVVLDHPIDEPGLVPPPLDVVAAGHRRIVKPFQLGRAHRVLHRRDQAAARAQPAGHPVQRRPQVGHVVEGQAAHHQVDPAIRQGQVLGEGLHVADPRPGGAVAGQRQHAQRRVGPQHPGGATEGQVPGQAAVAAAEIKHGLPGHVGQQRPQGGLLNRRVDAALTVPQLLIAAEERLVVVDVLPAHRWPAAAAGAGTARAWNWPVVSRMS